MAKKMSDDISSESLAIKYVHEMESYKDLLDINRQYLHEAHIHGQKCQAELQSMKTKYLKVERQLVRFRQFYDTLKIENKLKNSKLRDLTATLKNVAEKIQNTRKFTNERNTVLEKQLVNSDQKLQDMEKEIVNLVAENLVLNVSHNILDENSRRYKNEQAVTKKELNKMADALSTAEMLKNVSEETMERLTEELTDTKATLLKSKDEIFKLNAACTSNETLKKTSEEKVGCLTEELTTTEMSLKAANDEILNITAAYISSEALKNVLEENVQSLTTQLAATEKALEAVNGKAISVTMEERIQGVTDACVSSDMIDTLAIDVDCFKNGVAEKVSKEVNGKTYALSESNLVLNALKNSPSEDMQKLQYQLGESDKKYAQLNEQMKNNIAYLQSIVSDAMLASCGEIGKTALNREGRGTNENKSLESYSSGVFMSDSRDSGKKFNGNGEGDYSEFVIGKRIIGECICQESTTVTGNDCEKNVKMSLGIHVDGDVRIGLEELKSSLLSVFNRWKNKVKDFEILSQKIELMKKDKCKVDVIIHEGLIALKERLLTHRSWFGRGFSKKMEIVNVLLDVVEEDRGLMEI